MTKARDENLQRLLAKKLDAEVVEMLAGVAGDSELWHDYWKAIEPDRRVRIVAADLICELRAGGITTAAGLDDAMEMAIRSTPYRRRVNYDQHQAIKAAVLAHFEAYDRAKAQGYTPTETILAQLQGKLSSATQDIFLHEVEAHAVSFGDTMPGEPFISETALHEILARVEKAEVVLQEARAKRCAEQERRDLEMAFLKTVVEFRRLKPLTRRLFPFILDLRLLESEWTNVRVEVKANPPEVVVKLPNSNEPIAMPIDHEWDWITSDVHIPGRAPGENGAKALDLTMRLYLCAMLAVIDLLTCEVRLVERKREIKKKIHPDKCVPPLTYSYRPVIYAPHIVTVVKDRQIEVVLEQAREKRERKEAERVARETRDEEAKAQVEVARAEQELVHLRAIPRPLVKHLVPCHIRRVRMSIKQQLRLALMMANGWTPINKEGHEIPFPRDGQYTLVVDHIRGSTEPEVVSRRVITALVVGPKEM